MDKLFRYEIDLLKRFEMLHFSKEQTILINEMEIRWGNIDLVEINTISLPFSLEQCEVLRKPSCAKIFMKLKNKRPISKQKLFRGLGVSESTFNRALYELVKLRLVVKENNNYFRNINFVFPNVTITGYEAKLTNYDKALYQASYNKEYVDYSYMVFPMDMAKKIYEKHKSTIRDSNVGLIGVSDKKTQIYMKPCRNEPMKPDIRLINLVLSYESIHDNRVV